MWGGKRRHNRCQYLDNLSSRIRNLGILAHVDAGKLDRMGANTARVVDDLKRRFSPDVILINQPVKEVEAVAGSRSMPSPTWCRARG